MKSITMKYITINSIIFLFACTSIGCSASAPNNSSDAAPSGVTRSELAKQLGPAACEDDFRCDNANFNALYPGGIVDCEQQLINNFPRPNDLSPCVQSEIDACNAGIAALGCGDALAGNLPSDCYKCLQ